MKLPRGHQLAYCTNIHRGESWPETFHALATHTLAVRDRVCPHAPFAIGLRLGHQAARDLARPETLREFRHWLDANACYVFTINGFPYGQFHQTRVKEDVYRPDWATPERLAYTNLLFDLLAELLPPGVEGSVSTLPGSFKEFAPAEAATDAARQAAIRQNLWQAVEHIARLADRTGQTLHLGLEPEPLCLLETTAETIHFFEQLRAEHPGDPRLAAHLGVNYDTCHLAVEFEEPAAGLASLADHGIKLSKIHLSSALKTRPTPAARAALQNFTDPVYLHQTIVRNAAGRRTLYRDLPDALARHPHLAPDDQSGEEWRIHFHVPLHAPAAPPFANTTDHLLGTLDYLAAYPGRCSHLEMETYTWEVLPPDLKSQSVVDQLAQEYAWTLARLGERGLA